MSQHRSLRAASTLGGKRNVLKRFERTELLKKRGQRKDGDRITGLHKTKPEGLDPFRLAELLFPSRAAACGGEMRPWAMRNARFAPRNFFC